MAEHATPGTRQRIEMMCQPRPAHLNYGVGFNPVFGDAQGWNPTPRPRPSGGAKHGRMLAVRSSPERRVWGAHHGPRKKHRPDGKTAITVPPGAGDDQGVLASAFRRTFGWLITVRKLESTAWVLGCAIDPNRGWVSWGARRATRSAPREMNQGRRVSPAENEQPRRSECTRRALKRAAPRRPPMPRPIQRAQKRFPLNPGGTYLVIISALGEEA